MSTRTTCAPRPTPRRTPRLITAQADIPLAQAWGGGLLAAVDGVRFVVPVRSIDARPNPRYFGRRRGVTLLNLVNDQAVGLAGHVVSGTPRDSLHVIDLIYRQDGGRRPEVIISDTGSLQRHGVRADAPARVRLPPAAGRPARRQAVADQPERRLRPARHRRPRQDRPQAGPRALARSPAAGRLHPHRRGQRPRRAADARPRRQPDPARRGAGPLRADLQDPACAVVCRSGALSGADQGHAQPARRPPRPGPTRLPWPPRRSAPRLSRGNGGPARRARAGPELHHAVEHRLPRRRPRPAARRGVSGARRGRRASLGLHAPPPQRARALLVPNSPTSPGPAARCATPIPATTKSADRRRPTGAELLTARRAVPDVPAA